MSTFILDMIHGYRFRQCCVCIIAYQLPTIHEFGLNLSSKSACIILYILLMTMMVLDISFKLMMRLQKIKMAIFMYMYCTIISSAGNIIHTSLILTVNEWAHTCGCFCKYQEHSILQFKVPYLFS